MHGHPQRLPGAFMPHVPVRERMGTLLMACCLPGVLWACDAQVLDDPTQAVAGSSSGGGLSAADGGAGGTSSGGTVTGGSDGFGAVGSSPAPPTWEEALEPAPLREETRPPRPADVTGPELAPMGSVGWRESSAPLCTSTRRVTGAQLWADDHGVAAVVSAFSSIAPIRFELWHNPGAGWEYLGLSVTQVAGVPGGDLVVESSAGITSLDRDGTPGAHLEPDGTFGALLAGPQGVVVLGQVRDEDGHPLFYHFDGEAWSSGPGPSWAFGRDSNGYGIWVSPEATYLGAQDAVYTVGDNNELTELPDIPGPADYAGIVSTEAGLWLADRLGNIYLKGSDVLTHIRSRSDNENDSFIGFWTNGTDVFYLTEYEFGRAHEDHVQVISGVEGAHFLSIAGVSADEIFVAALNGADRYACDGLYLFHFDGEEFHQF